MLRTDQQQGRARLPGPAEMAGMVEQAALRDQSEALEAMERMLARARQVRAQNMERKAAREDLPQYDEDADRDRYDLWRRSSAAAVASLAAAGINPSAGAKAHLRALDHDRRMGPMLREAVDLERVRRAAQRAGAAPQETPGDPAREQATERSRPTRGGMAVIDFTKTMREVAQAKVQNQAEHVVEVALGASIEVFPQASPEPEQPEQERAESAQPGRRQDPGSGQGPRFGSGDDDHGRDTGATGATGAGDTARPRGQAPQFGTSDAPGHGPTEPTRQSQQSPQPPRFGAPGASGASGQNKQPPQPPRFGAPGASSTSDRGKEPPQPPRFGAPGASGQSKQSPQPPRFGAQGRPGQTTEVAEDRPEPPRFGTRPAPPAGSGGIPQFGARTPTTEGNVPEVGG